MTFVNIVITLVMLKSFSSCSQSHGFILHSEIPWLWLTIQKQKWDYSFCPCQSQRFRLFSCRPQSRLQGAIVRWHYCPTNTAKSQLFYIPKKYLMHYLAQGSGTISRRMLSSKMEAYSPDWWWGGKHWDTCILHTVFSYWLWLSLQSTSCTLNLSSYIYLGDNFAPNNLQVHNDYIN